MIWAFVTRYNRALIGLGCLLALFVAFRLYVSGQIEDARQKDAAAAVQVDAIADDVAGQIAASEAAKIEQENERARQAASDSDDSLKSAFDSLRSGKARDPKTAD